MNNKLVIAVILTAVIVGTGSFFGGMQYGKSARPNFARQNFNGQMGANIAGGIGARAGGARAGANFTAGEIIAKDSQSITVKLRDGSSKIVFLSASTAITKSVDGITDDLAVGKTVTVTGSANSDGSITAQMVQLRPAISVSPTPAQ